MSRRVTRNYKLLRDWRHSYGDRRPVDRRHNFQHIYVDRENFLTQRRECIEFFLDASQPMQDFLFLVSLQRHTGVTVMLAVGANVTGVPASVNVCETGVPKAAPFTSRSVATTVPLPGATLV